jgi:hypothetical protein
MKFILFDVFDSVKFPHLKDDENEEEEEEPITNVLGSLSLTSTFSKQTQIHSSRVEEEYFH